MLQAQGWGSCQISCWEGIFSPRTDWQGICKDERWVHRARCCHHEHVGKRRDIREVKNSLFYLMVPSIPQKSVHNPLSLSPTPPAELQSTKEWLHWAGWDHSPLSYAWILEQNKIFFTTFISTVFLNKAELKLCEFQLLDIWDREVFGFFPFVFKECLQNMFQLSGRKELERKREQRETSGDI